MDKTRKYLTDYKRNNYKSITILFNKDTEKHYIEFLDTIKNKKEFFKKILDEYLEEKIK